MPFFCMILVVCLGHGISHPVRAVLIFLSVVFGRGLELPYLRTPEKKVVHAYRSTRLKSYNVYTWYGISVPTFLQT